MGPEDLLLPNAVWLICWWPAWIECIRTNASRRNSDRQTKVNVASSTDLNACGSVRRDDGPPLRSSMQVDHGLSSSVANADLRHQIRLIRNPDPIDVLPTVTDVLR